MRPWRSPLLHFALLGAALFGLEAAWRDAGPEPLPAPDLARLADEATRETGRPPTPAELAARAEAWRDDELLLREARARGWDRSDPVVRRQLVRNLRFLGEEGPDEELLARAFALGLDRTDTVVRRRLVERMRLALAEPARARAPSEAELAALLRREAGRFRRPPRVRLTQVFLSRDRRGAALEGDARALLAELHGGDVSPDAAAALGDPFLVPAALPLWDERRLAARLGPDFARAAFAAEPGAWTGPVASSYGLHLVRVEERREARLPPLAEIRVEVEAAWRAEREAAELRDGLAALRRAAGLVASAGSGAPAP